jgi:Na+-driven multidrug efflux pump
VIKPAVGFPVLSVLLNIALAPLLIFGIGPWPRLGVVGAALATFISILIADILIVIYFEKKYHYLRFRLPLLRPQIRIWRQRLAVGVPAGAEFVLLFVYLLLVYAIIRGFGPAAQAGFGVGARVMQVLFLPVVALSFAVAPVVAQNFGGRRADRVRRSVYAALGIASAMMFILTLIAYLVPSALIRVFSQDPRVIAFGGDYLKIVSLNFVAAGIVFTISSVFQGMGNTLPPLLSSITRLILFALPALLISRLPGFEITYVWYLSVGSQVIQGLHQSLAAPSRIAAKARVSGTRGGRANLILPLDICGRARSEVLAPKARDESERQIDSGGHASGGAYTLVDYKSVASPDVDFTFGQGIEEFVMRGRRQIFQNAGRRENECTGAH